MSITSDIIDIVERHSRFLITTHVRSDGDAIGSEMAAWSVLRSYGKDVQVVNDGAVPRVFQFLDPDGIIETDPTAARQDAEVALVLDATSLERVGDVAKHVPAAALLVNIDHHVSNEQFGAANYVDGHASSTGEMLYRLMKQAGAAPALAALEALYTAIITDTGRFTHPNTTPEALEAAADLVRAGVAPAKIAGLVYRSEPAELALLRGKASSTLELFEDGQIATMHLTRQMFEETGVDPIDTQEFADLPRSLAGVEAGILFRELDEPGKVKVSFRSRDKVDVNAVAARFGGGGHVRASGCTVDGGLDAAMATVVAAVADALRES